MSLFLYDVKLFATVRVRANSEQEARSALRGEIDGAEVTIGTAPGGEPITAQLSVDDEHPELVEVNGVAV